jgi:hypothetical protein
MPKTVQHLLRIVNAGVITATAADLRLHRRKPATHGPQWRLVTFANENDTAVSQARQAASEHDGVVHGAPDHATRPRSGRPQRTAHPDPRRTGHSTSWTGKVSADALPDTSPRGGPAAAPALTGRSTGGPRRAVTPPAPAGSSSGAGHRLAAVAVRGLLSSGSLLMAVTMALPRHVLERWLFRGC